MRVTKLTPNFEVTDIKQTVAYYAENFGFRLVICVPETQDGIDQSLAEGKTYVYAMMQKDNVEIFFQRTDTFKEDVVFSQGLPIGASVSFYMDIEGIREFYQEMRKRNLEITDLKTTWYGMQEFYLKDLNGYILGFAEKA
ncbi:VOC family protein [Elizabethkingia anophelis]|uniref:bleomycin resistance family protein n=1 Tax=Elizabethkingia anophelis TaxID=1117645 RepID=UPI0016270DDE|nr:bleomycin resistance family protein [Elizabethkingia anophelis]MCT4322652.1 bleomycin resistance family protein [Elizabethkingia anophelis]HAY3535253.1 bleomycin resistance family protein [Elizabethkingia anophelis]HAY3547369.1 bleomycin resistance family protein [Elizabethkingia anophelis]HAY3591951.1 bleomycin resistance family protein [Elizabethkingia anophelis]